MTSFIVILENDIKAGWAWVESTAIDIYNTVSAIVGPAIKAFEQVVIQDLWGAAATLVQKLAAAIGSPTALADIETAFVNIAQTLGGGIYQAAIALGSTALQSILGLIQMKHLPPAAAT